MLISIHKEEGPLIKLNSPIELETQLVLTSTMSNDSCSGLDVKGCIGKWIGFCVKTNN